MFIELQNSVKEQFPCHFWFPRYEIVRRERECLCFGVEFTIFLQILRSWFLLSRSTLVLLHLLRILYSLSNFCGYLNFFCCLICLFMIMNEKNRNYFWLFFNRLNSPKYHTHTHTNTHTTHRNRNGKAIIFGWSNDETIDIAYKTSERYRGTSGEKKEVSFDLFIIYFPIRKGVRGER